MRKYLFLAFCFVLLPCFLAIVLSCKAFAFSIDLCETMEGFESYTNTGNLTGTWKDSVTGGPPSNGAVATLVQGGGTDVYEGDQSMLINYDRADFATSGDDKVERIYSVSQNLTLSGAKFIKIAYKSDEESSGFQVVSTTDTIYMELEDDSLNIARIDYTGEVNDSDWAIWYIAFSEVNDAGADPCDIKKIRLMAESTSSSGNDIRVFYDSLERCAQFCRPGFGPVADVNGSEGEPDCFVDEWDLDVMAFEWLSSEPNMITDFDNSNFVDFNDFAILANDWYEERLWPEY